jgi:hypothetical protein
MTRSEKNQRQRTFAHGTLIISTLFAFFSWIGESNLLGYFGIGFGVAGTLFFLTANCDVRTIINALLLAFAGACFSILLGENFEHLTPSRLAVGFAIYAWFVCGLCGMHSETDRTATLQETQSESGDAAD